MIEREALPDNNVPDELKPMPPTDPWFVSVFDRSYIAFRGTPRISEEPTSYKVEDATP